MSFAQKLAEFTAALEAVIDGGPFSRLVRAYAAVEGAEEWFAVPLQSLLPLCDALTKARARRLPAPGAPAPARHLLAPRFDVIFISAIYFIISEVLAATKRTDEILNAAAWAPGERLRLLASPLSALADYALHSRGLVKHWNILDDGDLEVFEVEHNSESIGGAITFLSELLGGMEVVYGNHGLIKRLQEGAAAAPDDRELQAVLRTVPSDERAMLAANVVLDATMLPEVLAETGLAEVAQFSRNHLSILHKDGFEPSPALIQATYRLLAKLLDVTVLRLTMEDPPEATDFDMEADDLFKLVAVVFKSGVGLLPEVEESLPKAARCVEAMLEDVEDEYDKWMCRTFIASLHILRLRTQGFKPLNDATTAFIALLPPPERLEGVEDGEVDDVSPTLAAAAELYAKGVHRLVQHLIIANQRQQHASQVDLERYMTWTRCSNAVLTAVSLMQPCEMRQSMAFLVATFVEDQRTIFPGSTYDDATVSQRLAAARLASEYAMNTANATLAMLAGTWPACQHPGEDEQTFMVYQAVMYVKMCLAAMGEAYRLTSSAAVLTTPGAPENAMLQDPETAALVLKSMYVLERVEAARLALGAERLAATYGAKLAPLLATIHNWLAMVLVSVSEVIVPALTAADVSVLEWIAEVCRNGPGEEGETVLSAEKMARLEDVIAAAAEVDASDEAAAKARTRILAAGGMCVYPGCCTLKRPGIDGLGKKNLLCSGCRTARYCAAACQKADWKKHKVACRAIQAERGG